MHVNYYLYHHHMHHYYYHFYGAYYVLSTPLNPYKKLYDYDRYYLHLINEKTKTPIRLYKPPALPQRIRDEGRYPRVVLTTITLKQRALCCAMDRMLNWHPHYCGNQSASVSSATASKQ